MYHVRELLSDLKKYFIQWLRGVAIIIVGMLFYQYHKTLNNPGQDAISFWQNIGNGIVLIGLLELAKFRHVFKSEEETRHEILLNKLSALEAQIAQLKENPLDLQKSSLPALESPLADEKQQLFSLADKN